MKNDVVETEVREWLAVSLSKFTPLKEIPRYEVYESYRRWSVENLIYPVHPNIFGKVLISVLPHLRSTQPRLPEGRTRCYVFPATKDNDDIL